MPAQPVGRDLPVMRQIAHGFAAGIVEPGQSGKDLSYKMLFSAARQKTRLERIEWTVIGNAQRRRIILPLPAQKRMQQRAQRLGG